MAVEHQQRELEQGSRTLKNDLHLISLSLGLMQKMMFLQPKLMKVLSMFPDIERVFKIVFFDISVEKIQQKFSQTFLDICKKLDQDLPKVMGVLDGTLTQTSAAADSKANVVE